MIAVDDTLLSQLRSIAERAGAVILEIYAQSEAVEVREKADSSPVTAADEAAEAVILDALAALTPEIPVVSEEAFEAGKIPKVGDQPFWLVDPLDGTKEFLSRNGEFTVNIALVSGGLPVAGVVHAPALSRTWLGAAGQGGEGKALEIEGKEAPKAISVRATPATGATVVASRRHGAAQDLGPFLGGRAVASEVSAGSSIKFCLVACGEADLYPRFGRTMEWDTAAGQAVLMAAGGEVILLDGRPFTYGKPGFENPHFVARGWKGAA